MHYIVGLFIGNNGKWQHEQVKPIIKIHGRKEKSIFGLGLDFLISAFVKTFMLQENSDIKEVIPDFAQIFMIWLLSTT